MRARSLLARALPGAAVLTLVGCPEPAHVEKTWRAMGNDVSVELHAGTEHVALVTAEEIAETYRRAEALFDANDRDSELARLNATAADRPYEIGEPDLYRCVKIASEWARATDGAFDPVRTPEDLARPWEQLVLYPEARAVRFRSAGIRLDLAGVALGYAVDMAARNFARVGLEAALLRAGSIRYAWGVPPETSGWELPLGPFTDIDGPFATLTVRNRALAVRDARARSDVRVAVALADNAAEAEIASRALLAMGVRRAGALLERSRRLEALLIVEGPEGQYVVASASLRDHLRIDAAATRRFGEVRYLLPPS